MVVARYPAVKRKAVVANAISYHQQTLGRSLHFLSPLRNRTDATAMEAKPPPSLLLRFTKLVVLLLRQRHLVSLVEVERKFVRYIGRDKVHKHEVHVSESGISIQFQGVMYIWHNFPIHYIALKGMKQKSSNMRRQSILIPIALSSNSDSNKDGPTHQSALCTLTTKGE